MLFTPRSDIHTEFGPLLHKSGNKLGADSVAVADGIRRAEMEIEIIKNGGTAWFDWYTDLNGEVCTDARWVNTKYGTSLVVNFADGRTIWTSATTEKGLARKGLKQICARFPVWVKSFCNGSGLLGVFNSSVGQYRAELNRATGEYHPEPYEIAPYRGHDGE